MTQIKLSLGQRIAQAVTQKEARTGERHPYAFERRGARCDARRARAEAARRMDAQRIEVRAIVATGVCPKCGRKLRRNFSLAGWWQCSQFGAIGFRADAEQPSCDWQGFTE